MIVEQNIQYYIIGCKGEQNRKKISKFIVGKGWLLFTKDGIKNDKLKTY